MKGFRNMMAESIVKQGDTLHKIEDFNDGTIVMWLIYDPCGRKPQYQVWDGDKRGYVGSDSDSAYADFNKRKDEWIASWALI